MSKIPSISSSDLIKYLNSKGFFLHHTKGSHHVLRSSDNRFVVVPHRKEIGKGLLLSILAEINISREEFVREWNS